jgi:hypothetical protein
MSIEEKHSIVTTCNKCKATIAYEADGYVPDVWLEDFMDDRDYYFECDQYVKKATNGHK